MMKIALFSKAHRLITKRGANALEKTGFAHKFAETKAVNKAVDKLQILKVYTWFGIVGTTIKDFFGMIVYYFQSLNNQKIPEEKRKYVASYEVASGTINCVMPLALGLTIQNKTVVDEITYRLFKNRYVDPQKLAKATGAELQKLLIDQKLYRTCRNGLQTFMAIVLATIVSKRMIAPFIAGPVASWYKKKYLNDGETQNSKAGSAAKTEAAKNRPTPQSFQSNSIPKLMAPSAPSNKLVSAPKPFAGPIPPQLLVQMVATLQRQALNPYQIAVPRPMPTLSPLQQPLPSQTLAAQRVYA